MSSSFSPGEMPGPALRHPGPPSPWVLYWVGRLYMWLISWRIEGTYPPHPRTVVIAHPHTSNWDLPHMLAACWVCRVRISWLGKREIFRPPFAGLVRWLGGISVDRSAPQGLVAQVAEAIRGAERMAVAVPPSGTRSRREHWKSGFYWIAHAAQVPIVCGTLDYGRRRAGFGLALLPTGDVAADMEAIRAFYRGARGRYPDQETPVRLRDEEASA